MSDYLTLTVGGATIVQLNRPAPEAPIGATVSMRQARLALNEAGLLAAVQTAINALPEPDRTRAQISWDSAAEVNRDDAITQMLAAALSLSPAQLDNLFAAAAAIP